MKVKFFTVPNLLTLGNLLCGSYAAVVLIAYNDFPTAMLLIVAAALFVSPHVFSTAPLP